MNVVTVCYQLSARLSYHLLGQVDLPWAVDLRTDSWNFQVIPMFDLNKSPETIHPVEDSVTKRTCSFTGIHKMTMDAKLEKSGLVPGEPVELSLLIKKVRMADGVSFNVYALFMVDLSCIFLFSYSICRTDIRSLMSPGGSWRKHRAH